MPQNSRHGLTSERPRLVISPSSADTRIGQCDACSPVIATRGTFSHRPPSPEIPYHTSRFISQPLDATHRTLLFPEVNAFCLLNQSALECLEYFTSPRVLREILPAWNQLWGRTTVEQLLHTMIASGLLLEHGAPAPVLTEVPHTLAVWLHLTDCCNLRCAYCYLRRASGEMSLATGQAALDAALRSAKNHYYEQIKVKYAGGEPLLRFPLIAQLHQYARQMTREQGLQLDGVVLSNGTLLTRKIVRDMRSLGLRLMISLDQMEQTPTPQRRFPDGRNAAVQAMQAIEMAVEEGLTPEISLTVSGRNIDEIPVVLEWVLDRALPFSLNFYRENAQADQQQFEDLRLDEERVINGMLAAYQVIEHKLPPRNMLASLVDLANFGVPHIRRCSVGQSYLVVSPDGRIAKCQMQLQQPITTVRADDPLAAVRADTQGIQNLPVDEKEGCRDCQWKYSCAGGCPLETYRATGRYDQPSPLCRIYQALYPEALRLEGLRLMQSWPQAV